jgi:hypothetical protein
MDNPLTDVTEVINKRMTDQEQNHKTATLVYVHNLYMFMIYNNTFVIPHRYVT